MSVTTTVIPALIDALVATARATVTGVTVYDGVGNSDDPGDYLMIGVSDPDDFVRPDTATAKQDWANIGYASRDEIGEIRCVALSWNGDMDQKAARDAVAAAVDAFWVALRANPPQGVASVLWVSPGTDVTLSQVTSKSGVLAMLRFAIHFEARV